MKNKHVIGPKHCCQLNQFSSCQRILLTEIIIIIIVIVRRANVSNNPELEAPAVALLC